VQPANVEFLNDEMGTPNRVRVTVKRTVNTLVAQYFGIATTTVPAVATAEASNANAMTCVKPFTIPDKWVEKQTAPWDETDSFDRYNNKGVVLSPADVYEPAYVNGAVNPNYSGYNTEQNRGMRLVLRAPIGGNIAPGMYFSLAMTNDTGGQDYRWNIANCNHTIYHWDDPLIQEPGAMQGPTIDGITELIARDPGAYWDDSTNTVKNSAFGGNQSPRVFPIPLFDPDYYQGGKTTGRVATLKTANWIGFFAEYIGGSSEIHGRIIPIGGIRDRTTNLPFNPAFPKVIRLVQ